jgi:hypothetical protein
VSIDADVHSEVNLGGTHPDDSTFGSMMVDDATMLMVVNSSTFSPALVVDTASKFVCGRST